MTIDWTNPTENVRCWRHMAAMVTSLHYGKITSGTVRTPSGGAAQCGAAASRSLAKRRLHIFEDLRHRRLDRFELRQRHGDLIADGLGDFGDEISMSLPQFE